MVAQLGVTENTDGAAALNAAARVNVPVLQIVAIGPAVVCCVIVAAVSCTAATNVCVVEQFCGVACVVSTCTIIKKPAVWLFASATLNMFVAVAVVVLPAFTCVTHLVTCVCAMVPLVWLSAGDWIFT